MTTFNDPFQLSVYQAVKYLYQQEIALGTNRINQCCRGEYRHFLIVRKCYELVNLDNSDKKNLDNIRNYKNHIACSFSSEDASKNEDYHYLHEMVEYLEETFTIIEGSI